MQGGGGNKEGSMVHSTIGVDRNHRKCLNKEEITGVLRAIKFQQKLITRLPKFQQLNFFKLLEHQINKTRCNKNWKTHQQSEFLVE